MAETTVVRTNTVSGTTFTIDVSGLALDADLGVKDFIVTHNSVDTTLAYTKTSTTLVTYSGTAVVLGTIVEVFRSTSLTFGETSYLSTTTAFELTNAMSKLKRRVDELEARNVWQTALIQQGGLSLGTIPILNNAYDATAWDGDTLNAPSRNAVRDKLVTIDATGTTVAGQITALQNADIILSNADTTLTNNLATTNTTVATNLSNSSKLAFLGFFGSETISSYAGSILNRSINQDTINATFCTFASSVVTIVRTGLYLIIGNMTISVNCTPPQFFDFAPFVTINGVDFTVRLGRHQVFDTAFNPVEASCSGSSIRLLTSGTTVRLRSYFNITGSPSAGVTNATSLEIIWIQA